MGAQCCKGNPNSDSDLTDSKTELVDTVNKLTAQLKVFETQLKQVQIENEKLTREKELSDRNVDATTRERDQLKEKLQILELELSSKINKYSSQISSLEATVQELHGKLQTANTARGVEIEQLIQEKGSLQHTVDNTTKERDKLKCEIQEIQLQFTNKEKEYSNRIKILEDSLFVEKFKAGPAQAEIEKLTRDKEILENSFEDTSKKNDQLKKEIVDLKIQLSNKAIEYSTQINKLEATVQEFNDQLQSADNVAQAEIEKLSREKMTLENSVDDTSKENDQLKKEIDALKRYQSFQANQVEKKVKAAVNDLSNLVVSLSEVKKTLEITVNRTMSERDELKEKLRDLELQLISKEKEYSSRIEDLEDSLLREKLRSGQHNIGGGWPSLHENQQSAPVASSSSSTATAASNQSRMPSQRQELPVLYINRQNIPEIERRPIPNVPLRRRN